MFLRRFFKHAALFTLLLCAGFFFAHPIQAASPVDQTAFESFAADAGFATGVSVVEIIARLIRTVIGFLGVITVVLILYGGFMYMTAGGETTRIEKAKKLLKSALIGLVIVLASFTIAQFIVNSVSEATNGTISGGCDPTISDCSPNPYTSPIPTFSLGSSKAIIQCAAGVRNLKLPFVFSRAVNVAAIMTGGGITITKTKQDGNTVSEVVAGTFVVAGQKVTFTPPDTCPAPNGTLNCFPSNATFHVNVDKAKVKSATGSSLTCKVDDDGNDPCSFDFSTGTSVDLAPPADVSMTAPNPPTVVQGMGNKLLQALTKDDVGVSTVDFYVQDNSLPIFTSDITKSTLKTISGLLVPNYFNTDVASEWNPAGLATNKAYPVWAVGADCAGNEKTSAKYSVMVRALNCGNKTKDDLTPYFEKGIDCGGTDKTSQYYCGLCPNDVCKSNADCSSGYCAIPAGKTEGTCQDVTVIESVSPDSGAVGNLVTISGIGFGSTPGSVDFLGTEGGTIKNALAYACPGSTSWTQNQIVVQVPSGTIDGPIRVNVKASGDVAAHADRTDDTVGPIMSKFDVNAIKRPGLCSLVSTPATTIPPAPWTKGVAGTELKLNGILFGATKGSSTVFLTNFEATTTSWADGLLKALVPNVEDGVYDTQVYTGDYYCLDIQGKKASPATLCQSDNDCKADPNVKCAMSWCSEDTSIYCSSNAQCQTKTATVCTTDASCGAANQYCDAKTKLCVVNKGTCTDVRVGSNAVKFEAVHVKDSASVPIITSIDSGLKACVGNGKCQGLGSNSVMICGKNSSKTCTTDANCDAGVKCDYWYRFCSISKRSCGFDTDKDCAQAEGTCTYHSPGFSSNGVSDPKSAGFCQNTGTKYFFSCDKNSDCDVGALVCSDQGPSGQYVTIKGSGFGSTIGSVKFTNATFGDLTASTDFPAACPSSASWTDNQIIVKVPYNSADKTPLNPDTADHGKFSVTVQAQGKTSDAYKDLFQVLGNTVKPSPGICAITPNVGPVGSSPAVPITIIGENLGATKGSGTVTFNTAKPVSPPTWKDEDVSVEVKSDTGVVTGNKSVKTASIGLSDVPAGSTTGLVFVTDGLSKQSNSMNFKVGNCKTDETIVCATSQTCCANGSCNENDANGSSTCDDTPHIAQFAYKVSTNAIPVAPQVVVNCYKPYPPSPNPDPKLISPSPSPSPLWSKQDDICVGSAVTASFTIPVDQLRLDSNNIIVQKCGAEANGECTKWIDTPLVGSIAKSAQTFTFSPNPVFEPNTLYQVTIKGASATNPHGGIQTASAALTNQVSMVKDFVWTFKTKNSASICTVGGVAVSPAQFTSTQPGQSVGYLANLLSQTDDCIVLACTGHSIAWTNDTLNAADLDAAKFISDSGADVASLTPPSGVCSVAVDPRHDTTPNSPVPIKAVADNNVLLHDSGALTIISTDPRVKARFPDCSQACPKVMPWVQFNVKMDPATVNKNTFKLYECSTPACNVASNDEAKSTDGTHILVTNVDNKEVEANSQTIDDRAFLHFGTATTDVLKLDTSYRIVLKNTATLVTSYYKKLMFGGGSNHNNPLADPSNLTTIGDGGYSWKFRTKATDVSCGADHVEIVPKDAVLSYVGQHQEYYGTIHGIPDDCSASGQTLQDGNAKWTAWTATDTPDKVTPAIIGSNGENTNAITSFMIKHGAASLYGQIALAPHIPNYCSSNCLLTGSSSAICGNKTIDYGEECDDGSDNGKVGNPCSSSCLLTGNVSAFCGNGIIENGEACDDGNNASNDGCSSMCKKEGAVAPSCGIDNTVTENAITKAGEACDHGINNGIAGDKCSKSCLLVGNSDVAASGSNKCGNSTVDASAGEECDLGTNNGKSGSGCSAICLKTGSAAPICKAGANLVGLACADDNNVSGDGCSSACLYEGSNVTGTKINQCGDGVIQTVKGEECDDGTKASPKNGKTGNGTAGDGCSAKCLLVGSGFIGTAVGQCGDKIVDANKGEECDDGVNNGKLGSGCSAVCLFAGVTKPICGKNKIENGESCDDDNKIDGDGCSSVCLKEGATVSFCGNKKIDNGEACDNGADNGKPGNVCSNQCLLLGNSSHTNSTDANQCGNNKVESTVGEECDDGNIANGDGCSSVCLWEGVQVAKTLVCGDGIWSPTSGESCDDGNNQNGDGCSSICLKEGSKTYGKICKNGDVEFSLATKAGEACDDGNDVSGDGCSSNCLWEGSLSASSGSGAICGNGGAPELGEACDAGGVCGDGTTSCAIGGAACATGTCHVIVKDGCSTHCLHTGTIPGTDAAKQMCGNGAPNPGEDSGCDLGGGKVAIGCTDHCLLAGSSVKYANVKGDANSGPSFCGDGETKTGEVAACETGVTGTKVSGGYAVAEIAEGAPREVNTDPKINGGIDDNPNYGYAISKVNVSVAGQVKPTNASATLSLYCSCESDSACNATGVSLGCGTSKCCFERPKIELDQAPVANAPPVCRNTAVYVKFSQAMDGKSFGSFTQKVCKDGTKAGNSCTDATVATDCPQSTCIEKNAEPNLQLELTKVHTQDLNLDGVLSDAEKIPVATDVNVTATNCPYYPEHVAFAPAHNFLAFVWNAIVRFFGQPALALTDSPYTGSTKCLVPLTYQQDFNHKAYLSYGKALEPLATYKVTIKTMVSDSDKGVLSANQVGVQLDNALTSQSYQFTTGTDICLLDVVNAVDNGITPAPSVYESTSPGYYSATNEKHGFIATPYAVRKNTGMMEQIASIPGTYSWTWGWNSSAPAMVCKGGTNAGNGCTAQNKLTVCGNTQGIDCVANTTSKILGIDGVANVVSSYFKALGNNGTENVIATATVTDTISPPSRCSNDITKVCDSGAQTFCTLKKTKSCTTNADCTVATEGTCDLPCPAIQGGVAGSCSLRPPAAVSGLVSEVAFLCSNPWPALNKTNAPNGTALYGVPYKDSVDDTAVNAIHANFSMFYCKDAGDALRCSGGDKDKSKCTTNDNCKRNTASGQDGVCAAYTEDDLMTLQLPPTISTPASKSIHSDILKEFVFNIQDANGNPTKDSIGIRVLKNTKYLSALAWFKDQGFSDSPKSMKLDGYDAVQTGSTIYVAAANLVGSVVYSNIYAISYNGDAGKGAQEIFDLLLQNFRFNADATYVTQTNSTVKTIGDLCSVVSGTAQAFNDPGGNNVNCTTVSAVNKALTTPTSVKFCKMADGSLVKPNGKFVTCYNASTCGNGLTCEYVALSMIPIVVSTSSSVTVSNVGLCKVASGYSRVNASDPTSSFISCSIDEDCIDKCQADGTCSISGTFCPNGVGCLGSPTYGTCDADKQKLARDLKRLTDVTQMVGVFEKYGATHGHCAVSKSQSCVVYNNASVTPFHNPTCPGTETCYAGYPTVQSGTFVPSMSNSKWPSWNSALANAVGTALPTDPLNQFYGQCKLTDYDPATCWNGKAGNFTCAVGSHIYGYQNQGGGSYLLSTELEYNKVPWNDPIDPMVCSNDASFVCKVPADCTDTCVAATGHCSMSGNLCGSCSAAVGICDKTDHGTVQASYQTAPTGTLPTGFESTPKYCDAALYGAKNICGDGVKSGSAVAGEVDYCEIGETKAIPCVVNKCTAGTTSTVGKSCVTNTDCGLAGACSASKVCTAGSASNVNHLCNNSGANTVDCGEAGVCGAAVPAQTGNINVTCNNACTYFQSIEEARLAGAVCKPKVCGNGIKDGAEICDDGALNGTYGHCDANCELTNAVSCGDGTLAGTEECDCGNTDAKRTAGGWSSQNTTGICSVVNGGYSTNGNPSCSADCKESGPYCGDKSVNGGEQCDGGSETYNGKFCADGVTQCTKDSECSSGTCGTGAGTKKDATYHDVCGQDFVCLAGDANKVGTVCTVDADCGASPNGVCSIARHCVGGSNANAVCSANADCTGGGICSATSKYDLTRNRVCANICTWGSGWSACQAGDQHCGNGAKEGTEECDDGNKSNNDGCLSSCKLNACGDSYVNVGIESCDSGTANVADNAAAADKCKATYGGTCNYCNSSCQYKTQSGAYCGNNAIDGNETCDGTSIPKSCIKKDAKDTVIEKKGSCKTTAECNTGSNSGYVCALVGAWNGGATNGQLCVVPLSITMAPKINSRISSPLFSKGYAIFHIAVANPPPPKPGSGGTPPPPLPKTNCSDGSACEIKRYCTEPSFGTCNTTAAAKVCRSAAEKPCTSDSQCYYQGGQYCVGLPGKRVCSYNDSCAKDSDCQGNGFKCVSQDSYQWCSNGGDQKGGNKSCKTNTDCPTDTAKCVNNKCNAQSNAREGQFCKSDSECTVNCRYTGTCQGNKNYCDPVSIAETACGSVGACESNSIAKRNNNKIDSLACIGYGDCAGAYSDNISENFNVCDNNFTNFTNSTVTVCSASEVAAPPPPVATHKLTVTVNPADKLLETYLQVNGYTSGSKYSNGVFVQDLPENQSITIDASEVGSSGYQFDTFSSVPNGAVVSGKTVTFNLTADLAITVNYKTGYTLTVTQNPSDKNAGQYSLNGSYDHGALGWDKFSKNANVILDASLTGNKFDFDNFGGDATGLPVKDKAISFTMDGNKSISINYKPAVSAGASYPPTINSQDVGTCVPPVCADNCGSSCPVSFKKISVQVQSNIQGATPSSGMDLYSYNDSLGKTPDKAFVLLPACLVGAGLTADVTDENTIPTNLDIVFVTSLAGSMKQDISGGGAKPSQIDMAAESIKQAIDTLTSAYASYAGKAKLKIGMIAVSDLSSEALGGVVDSSDASLGAQNGQILRDPFANYDVDKLSYATKLKNIADSYIANQSKFSGDADVGIEMSKAASWLKKESPKDKKIVVLITSSTPVCKFAKYNLYGKDFTVHTSSQKHTSNDACPAEIRGEIVDPQAGEIEFYTALIGQYDYMPSYMRHMSSETCKEKDMQDKEECTHDNFAFVSNTAEEIGMMYTKILANIFKKNIIVSANDMKGVSQTVSNVLNLGNEVAIPIPNTFACQKTCTVASNGVFKTCQSDSDCSYVKGTCGFGGPFTVAIQGSGYNGTIGLKNFNFSYCPVK